MKKYILMLIILAVPFVVAIEVNTGGMIGVDLNTQVIGGGNITYVGSGGNDSWNQTLAGSIYAPIGAGSDNVSWNQTMAGFLYADISVVDTNASTECAIGDYLDGSAMCIDLNETVLDLFESTQVIYNASTIDTTIGGVDAGNLNSILTLGDNNTYNVSEVAGTPGFTININFTNVVEFNVVALRGRYDGGAGHTVELEIYRVGVGWEERAEITDQENFGVTTFDIFIGANFIDALDTVQFRLNHDDVGNINHDYFMDYVVIGQVSGIVAATDLGGLTGRDEACEVLPDVFCKDGSKSATGNFNGGGFNLVNWTNINATDWTNVTITESQISDLTHAGNSSWNQTYANTLYAAIGWGYNYTTATYNLYNAVWSSTRNVSYEEDWNNTYNETYQSFATNVSLNYTKIVFDAFNSTWDDSASSGGNASWNESKANTLYEPIRDDGSTVFKFEGGKFMIKLT